MIKKLNYIVCLLAMGLTGLTACKDDDDSVDYTKYYDWRDQNIALSNAFFADIDKLGDAAYFPDSISSLSEPYNGYNVNDGSIYRIGTLYRVLQKANEDSLRRINRWYTPYATSTLSVRYTLYNPDSVWARFKEYDVLTDQSRRTDTELMNKIFGIGYQKGMSGYELKADTLESSQVKPYDGFTCSNVIKGWQDCLQHMHIGDSWLIMIPWYLAYGQAGSGSNIDPYTNLYFRLQLVDITYLGDNIEEK